MGKTIYGVPFRWEHDPQQVFVELTRKYVTDLRAGARVIAQAHAPTIEAWMKQNAPWQDRTGNARQTLYTEVQEVAEQMVDIILSHGVEYGEFLELAHGGAWAIVSPALDIFAPKIWADVQRMLK